MGISIPWTAYSEVWIIEKDRIFIINRIPFDNLGECHNFHSVGRLGHGLFISSHNYFSYYLSNENGLEYPHNLVVENETVNELVALGFDGWSI